MQKTKMLRVCDLTVARGEEVILSGIDFACGAHEIVSVVGRSGVGKTTLLKTIAGLIPWSSGSISVNDRDLNGPSRQVGLVFQEYCVFPWMTVERNIQFGSKCGRPSDSVEDEVEELLERTGLTSARNLYPSQLSGGMQQRVALARTLAADPEVLLLDEPFGALDALTRIRMQNLVRQVFVEMRQAVILVTHDIKEAVALSDAVVLLGGKPARLVEYWTVEKPRSSENPYRLPRAQEELSDTIFQLLGEDGKVA